MEEQDVASEMDALPLFSRIIRKNKQVKVNPTKFK